MANVKDIQISTLNFDLTRRGVPADVEAINEMAGSETAAYELALNQFLYHSDFTKLRSAIADKLEAETGVEREFKEEPTKSGDTRKVYTESEMKFVNRLNELADNGAEFTESDLARWAQEAVDGVEVDLTSKPRGAGSSATPAKKWLAYYDAAEEAGQVEDKIEKFNTVHRDAGRYTGPELSADDENIRNLFALACKEVVTKVQEEAMRSL